MKDILIKEKTVKMGDLNALIGNQVIPGIKNKFKEAGINELRELLIELCAHNEQGGISSTSIIKFGMK